jgi:hypothetical protein
MPALTAISCTYQATLAVHDELERRNLDFYRSISAQILEMIDRSCECAIRLVHLGANC